MNFCTACNLNFGSVKAFDTHRIGKFPQKGPADWLDRIKAGLVDPGEEWQPTPHYGRRCLEEDELELSPRFSRGRHGWTLVTQQEGGRRLRAREASAQRGIYE